MAAKPRPADKPEGAKNKEEQKKVLVGVRVPAAFHRRIQAECVRRDLSMQELLTAALKFYFKTPIGQWEPVNVEVLVADEQAFDRDGTEDEVWSDLWEKYRKRMPREKIEVFTGAMQFDLRTLKSSRRKPGVRRTDRKKAEQQG